MPDLTPRQLALYGLALLALVALAFWYAGRGGAGAGAPAAAAPPIAVQGAADREALVVHVAGAVRRPGVYRMRPGSRVDEAVTRAGGPRRRADLSALNLAAQLEDGRQVLVPLRAPAAAAATGGAGATASGVPGAAAAGASTVPAAPLNLNTATLEQLDELDGIGPTTAQHILEYREAHDGFRSVEELDQVPGIGETRLASLREQVTL
jgi:competence protein ComEA